MGVYKVNPELVLYLHTLFLVFTHLTRIFIVHLREKQALAVKLNYWVNDEVLQYINVDAIF